LQFDVQGWSDASGHFDIWNGTKIRYLEYFAKATTTTLWQHVTIQLKDVEAADGVCTAIYQFTA